MAELKRNMIELVVNPQEVAEGGEPEVKKYWTPAFIPFTKVREAMELAAELEKGETENVAESMDKLADFVTDLYGGQFTKDELYNGLHAPSAIPVIQEQILFVAQGQQSQATKNFLAKKN
jgi:hypothetical protein